MGKMNNRIAIFDDEQDILAICRMILEDAGYEVFTYEDCKNIVQRVTETDPFVILMDNQIPDTGGVLATQLLKNSEAVKHIAVIYFSASSDITALATQAGADAYLAKPFDLADLEKMIGMYSKTEDVK
jgi:CheY-like chemotaxis protein